MPETLWYDSYNRKRILLRICLANVLFFPKVQLINCEGRSPGSHLFVDLPEKLNFSGLSNNKKFGSLQLRVQLKN